MSGSLEDILRHWDIGAGPVFVRESSMDRMAGELTLGKMHPIHVRAKFARRNTS